MGNVVERLVVGHESGLGALEGAAMEYLKANVVTFQVGLGGKGVVFS